MEKTIQIDGKDVRLKSTAATPYRFKAQFNKDYIAEIAKLHKLGKIDIKKDGEPNFELIEQMDFEVFYNIVWCMAKTADKSIPEPLTWLDDFEEFPLFDILPQIQDMLAITIQGKKK
ncbi:prophage pi2 protein 40 [Sporosarcina globispora]|uniref:Prophage pi2 protein 40 n=1 Tax=Sporosarcina globispora TaxID=1459 RepID=A0A0M0GAZ9_SPOGL|nr:hypothetical protein [Sporosarcina globispora]KON86611.1 prophage pi2 protein 40 [Sporosarcina globispora]